jgi:hypothetical protein
MTTDYQRKKGEWDHHDDDHLTQDGEELPASPSEPAGWVLQRMTGAAALRRGCREKGVLPIAK